MEKESDSHSSSSSTLSTFSEEDEAKKWAPMAAPTVQPDNHHHQHHQMYRQPYVQYSPVEKPSDNPFDALDSWSRKAETIRRNICHNLTMGKSVSETAWGKMNLTAKVITEGGFECVYRQTFATDPNERLKKTFACYLSTSTGPVAGTMYLSTARVAFCSDRPLSFTAPSGQLTWIYYKVVIPLGNIGYVNPSEKYIQIFTVDGHEFWFMGFVNFEKAVDHILTSASEFRARGNAAKPVGAVRGWS